MLTKDRKESKKSTKQKEKTHTTPATPLRRSRRIKEKLAAQQKASAGSTKDTIACLKGDDPASPVPADG